MVGDWAEVVVVALAVNLAVVVLQFGFIAREVARRRGRWVAVFERARCSNCGESAPVVRVPQNCRQLFGLRWTCTTCGLECDKWGVTVHDRRA